jgi:hypothetical protein
VWRFARVPCDALPAGSAAAAASQAGGVAPLAGDPRVADEAPPPKFCEVDVGARFRCCGWPWTIPEYRQMTLSALRDARHRGDGRLTAAAVAKSMRKQLSADRTRNEKGCVANCMRLPMLNRGQVHTLLTELAERGDVVLERSTAEADRRAKKNKKSRPAPPEIIVRAARP